jgi:hypothetical protein
VPTEVTDSRSNAQDQIAHAARVIGGSKLRHSVFLEVMRGKRATKSVGEISVQTGYSRKQILNTGKFLADQQLVTQTRKGKDTAYQKVPFLSRNRSKIVSLATHPEKLARFPTKTNPGVGSVLKISVRSALVKTKPITVDDIDNFRKVRRIKTGQGSIPMLEREFKDGVAGVLGEPATFKDWGGEKGDLYTTRFLMKGKRLAAAFGFKGRGKTGRLTPAGLGKNGDQIQRLFTMDAEVFIIQYWDHIDESVLTQMGVFATAKSYTTGNKIYYGVIDGTDSSRLIAAYPSAFKSGGTKP